MKLKFKQQKFQADAAQAVVDVFDGQSKGGSNNYLMDIGNVDWQMDYTENSTFLGMANRKLDSFFDDDRLLSQIRGVQIDNSIKPSDKLEGDGINLSIEMETGERVIIVMGAVNVMKPRVSGTLNKYILCIA